MLNVAIISSMYGNKLYLPILTFHFHLVVGGFWWSFKNSVDRKHVYPRVSAWNDGMQMSKISLQKYVSMSERNEIDDESDDNSEQSEASDENSEEFDRTHILFPRPFFVSWLLDFKKQKQSRVYELAIQSAGSDKENIFRTFPLKSQNKHIKIFINFLLTSARKFYLRFKLIGQKIYYLRLIILIFNLLEYV